MIIQFFMTLLMLIIVAVWLDAVRASINSLSGGYVRSLDEAKRTIAEKWLEQQKELGFVLRSLSYVITVTYACFTYFNIVVEPIFVINIEAIQNIKKAVVFFLLMFLFLILKETLGTVWFSFYRFNLLKYSMPVLKIIRIILKPYEVILMHSFKKAQEREEQTPIENKDSIAENEILSLVEKGDNGELEEDEIRMIKGVFDLNDKQVREVMTPRVDVEAVDCESDLKTVIDKFVETNFSRLPVYKEKIDNIVGILYAKDFIDENKVKGSLESLYHDPHYVSETKALDLVLEDFRSSQNHFAVVLDQYGGTAGIITIEDILEEIVGEILDEYDHAHEEIEINVKESGEVIVDAKAAIHDINKALDDDSMLEESDDFDTIGGCIYTKISRIPSRGETISLENYDAKILHADERSIVKVKLIPRPEMEEK